MEAWHTWLIIAGILFILEIFTPGFVVACFGIGCLAGALMDYLHLGFEYQIIAFSVVSLVLFFTLRPIVVKHLYKTAEDIKTNVDALIDQIGVVDEKIDPIEHTGRVIVGGDNWKALSLNDEVIEKGEKVQVKKIDGVKLYVIPYKSKKED